MKYLRLFLIVAIVLAVLGFQAGQASAKKFSYTSGIQLQNLANASNSVTLTYYNVQTASGTGGGEAKTANVTMTPYASSTFFPVHADAGFSGSVVVSSSQPIASIVNLHANLSTTRVGNASYVGATAGATTINLPLLHKNNYGFDSWFSVQNASSTDATVNVAYSDGKTAGPIVIKAGASYVFDQQLEAFHTTLKVFGAKVTSDQPVVVVVVQERNSTSPTVVRSVLAYTGFDAAEADALMPLINANNYGFTTGIQIQNTGAQDSSITVTYTPTKDANGNPIGHECTETQLIKAGASNTFALYSFNGTLSATQGTTTCVKERFVGAAHVTANSANQNVVAIVNQQTARAAGAYGSFLLSRATNKVVMPLIMDRNYGWSTGFNLMNVGTATVDVACTFTGTTYAKNVTLAAGEALNDVQLNKVKDKYVGSGTCTATAVAGQTGTVKIAAVVNETSPDNYDNILTYEGMNVTP